MLMEYWRTISRIGEHLSD